jgi:hypothetical protein
LNALALQMFRAHECLKLRQSLAIKALHEPGGGLTRFLEMPKLACRAADPQRRTHAPGPFRPAGREPMTHPHRPAAGRFQGHGRAIAAAATAACLAALLGSAQAAPANPAANKPAAKAGKPIKVTVTNKREMAVTSIGFVAPGADSGGRNLLKKPLAPGKSIVVTVPAKKGECAFDVMGSYEDKTEISGSGMDLCADPKLTLVE